MDNDNKPLDELPVTLIGHICIRDPDTGEIIVRKRDLALDQPDDR
jgi:hypothetical protein